MTIGKDHAQPIEPRGADAVRAVASESLRTPVSTYWIACSGYPALEPPWAILLDAAGTGVKWHLAGVRPQSGCKDAEVASGGVREDNAVGAGRTDDRAWA